MIKKICSILSTVLMVLMVLVAAALLVPYLFGYRPMAVLSASMEPAYPTGSVVFVKKVEPAEIEIGDPITFHREGLAEPITHRSSRSTPMPGSSRRRAITSAVLQIRFPLTA